MSLVMRRTITYRNRIQSDVIVTSQWGLLVSNCYACPYCAGKTNVNVVHMMFANFLGVPQEPGIPSNSFITKLLSNGFGRFIACCGLPNMVICYVCFKCQMHIFRIFSQGFLLFCYHLIRYICAHVLVVRNVHWERTPGDN
jgi:hypothetical protein